MNKEYLIKETALQTIAIENEAINALKSSINTDFINAVYLIFKSRGRVIITGIGKSAIIGQKIVATLNSTGTPAIFMHAADAVHGDLGMILPNDVVICISKSGNTSEIKVLVPFLKTLGNKVIGIVANKNSFLAQNAHLIIYTPITKEADPNNLAPTASTTAQIVIGDAIATSLLAMRGFSSKDFAQFHPGGILGKQLYLRATDFLEKNERPFVFENATIRETIIEMTSKRLGCTAVLNKNEMVIGIITDGDLRRMLNKMTDFSKLIAKEIMSKNPIMIEKDTLAIEALNLMRESSITQLIITEGEKYLGILHLHDLIREGIV